MLASAAAAGVTSPCALLYLHRAELVRAQARALAKVLDVTNVGLEGLKVRRMTLVSVPAAASAWRMGCRVVTPLNHRGGFSAY